MLNLKHRVLLTIILLAINIICLEPLCLSQSFNQGGPQGAASGLGQSSWQTINQIPAQQNPSGQPLGQSEWQVPTGGNVAYSQVPGLPANNGASNMGQSSWQNPNAGMNQYQPNNQVRQNPNLGVSPWQQPQNPAQVNQNPQQNSDYYYGQVNNQNQQNPYAFNNGQYQGQANYSAQQPNNQTTSNIPPASSIPPQQTQQQTSQNNNSGLKSTLSGLARAAGVGMGVAAPLAGMYMMTKAMTSTVPSYGYPSMPYGYGGYPGMMPMSYAAPNYAMMNMAPMYSSALSGLSSFMTH